jgi:hypothetical protein
MKNLEKFEYYSYVVLFGAGVLFWALLVFKIVETLLRSIAATL